MKPWMKVLMWLGIGTGLGIFAGIQIGVNSERKRQQEMELYKQRERAKCLDGDTDGDELFASASNAMNVYSGRLSTKTDVTWQKNDSFDQSLEEPASDEEEPEIPSEDELAIDPDIPQLHPQHLIPEIIGEEEYNANIWQYSLESLIFYGMDEVLYDCDTQTIIEDPDSVIGIGTLNDFGGDPNNPTYTIYVKNDTFGTLFKIEYLDAAFCDVVDGTCGPTDLDEPDNPDESDDFWNDI